MFRSCFRHAIGLWSEKNSKPSFLVGRNFSRNVNRQRILRVNRGGKKKTVVFTRNLAVERQNALNSILAPPTPSSYNEKCDQLEALDIIHHGAAKAGYSALIKQMLEQSCSATDMLKVYHRYRLSCGVPLAMITDNIVLNLIRLGDIKELLSVLDCFFYTPSEFVWLQIVKPLLLTGNFHVFLRLFLRYCSKCDLLPLQQRTMCDILKTVLCVFGQYTLIGQHSITRTEAVIYILKAVDIYHHRLLANGIDFSSTESFRLSNEISACQTESWCDCYNPMYDLKQKLFEKKYEFSFHGDDCNLESDFHGDHLLKSSIRDASRELEMLFPGNHLLYSSEAFTEWDASSNGGKSILRPAVCASDDDSLEQSIQLRSRSGAETQLLARGKAISEAISSAIVSGLKEGFNNSLLSAEEEEEEEEDSDVEDNTLEDYDDIDDEDDENEEDDLMSSGDEYNSDNSYGANLEEDVCSGEQEGTEGITHFRLKTGSGDQKISTVQNYAAKMVQTKDIMMTKMIYIGMSNYCDVSAPFRISDSTTELEKLCPDNGLEFDRESLMYQLVEGFEVDRKVANSLTTGSNSSAHGKGASLLPRSESGWGDGGDNDAGGAGVASAPASSVPKQILLLDTVDDTKDGK